MVAPGGEERIELSLLGGFVFSVGGDALLGISAGSQRLLAFLAIRDRVTTRNQVAGTLWPESTDEQASASLRSAVSRLGGQARQAVKVIAGDLGLAEGVTVDVQLSEDLAADSSTGTVSVPMSTSPEPRYRHSRTTCCPGGTTTGR